MRNHKDPRRARFVENLRVAYEGGGGISAPSGVRRLEQSRGYQSGGRIADDITGLSDAGVLPDTVSREEGVDTEGGRRFLDILGDTAVELTGIPSIVRGVRNIGRGVSERDPLRGLQGAGEATLGALPGAAGFRAGRALLRALTASPGRAVGTTAALGATGLPVEMRDAQAEAEGNLASAVLNDPTVKALRAERDEVMKAYNAMNERHRRSGPVTQQSALKPLQDQLDLLNNKISEAEERARQAYIADAPFRERYPGAAEAIGYGAMGLGAAIPFANTVKKRLADAVVNAPSIRRSTRAANKAFDAGDDMAFIREQARLADKVRNWETAHSATAGAKDFAKSAGLAGLLAFEGAAVPEQVDALAFPPGHPTRERARDELTRKGYYLERVPPAVLSGIMTGGVGTKLGTTLTPGGRPELGAAREVIERGSDASIEALRRLRDYREVVDSAKRAAKPLPSAPTPSSAPSGQKAIAGPKTSKKKDEPHYVRQARIPKGQPGGGRWSGGYED